MLDWGGCVYEWVGPGDSDEEILKTKKEIAEIKGDLARRELEDAKRKPNPKAKPKANMIVVDLSDDEKEDYDEWVLPGYEEHVGDNGKPGDE